MRPLIQLCWTFCYISLVSNSAEAQSLYEQVEIFPAGVFGAPGVTAGDYDNDGRPDLLLTSTGSDGLIALLHNDGDGRFSDQTANLGDISRTGHLKGSGSSFSDYDNDGDLDLYLPHGWVAEAGVDRLLRNDRGTFTDVTLQAGLTDSLPSNVSSWLDYNRDGHLDLFVGHWYFNRAAPGLHNSLYRNNADGTFTDVSVESGLAIDFYPDGSHGGGCGACGTAADFNGDGWTDLYLGIHEKPNRLFLNDGSGTFEDATTGEIGDSGQALPPAIGDIDNDGNLDLFQPAGGGSGSFRSLMLLNLGEGQFLDVTEGVGLSAYGSGQVVGAGLGDIDNDGDLDLVTGSSNWLFLNNGDGTFSDANSQAGLKKNAGMLFTDYNLDGFLDAVFGQVPPERGEGFGGLFRNAGNDHHWLRIELVGTRSNRNGIGARLTAQAGDLQQTREILGGLSASETTVHFGLSGHTRVDSLEIRWPSGQVDVLTDIAADQRIRVIEGSGAAHPVVAARWITPPPDTLVVGAERRIEIAMQPALLESAATIAQVSADLRDFGGPEAVPLVAAGDGTYRLETTIASSGPNGFRALRVNIDQTTSLGPHWSQLSRGIAILPAGDLRIFAAEIAPGWSLNTSSRVMATPGEFLGAPGLELVATGNWNLSYLASEPQQRVGFHALRFAFHPGEAEGAFLNVNLNNYAPINLLVDNGAGPAVDLERKEWQTVEIPFTDLLQPGPTVETIRFSSNLRGAFYLGAVRLVAVRPPANTAVRETYTEVMPEVFALEQNYPNPFNSDTVINFALPQSENIELNVYNVAGQRVATLLEGVRAAGAYAVNWDGQDDDGQALASGVYLYRLQAGEGKVEMRKLLLLR